MSEVGPLSAEEIEDVRRAIARGGGAAGYAAQARLLMATVDALIVERDHLRELCATVNGDGGHRQVDVGAEQAVKEAQERFGGLVKERDQLREVLGRVEESASALCEAVGLMDEDVCPICVGEAAEDADDYDHDHKDWCLLVLCDVALDEARPLLKGGEDG